MKDMNIIINHPGWSNLKDTNELIVNLNIAFGNLIPITQRATFVMNELGKAMYRVAEKEYLKHHKKLPGSTNTKRLRKKRQVLVIRWFYSKLNIQK